jgi:hypothetical protein
MRRRGRVCEAAAMHLREPALGVGPSTGEKRRGACVSRRWGWGPSASEKGKRMQEKGAIGYILLWLLGVPASVLFVIFLLRGCT